MKKDKECHKKGGSIESHAKTSYEGHMVGEKKHAPHVNYEGDMKGEKKRRGKVQEFAMGGVAKIRHKQSTPKGFPVKRAARSV